MSTHHGPRPAVTIDELTAGVDARLRDGRADRVTAYLNTARVDPTSLAPYLHWADAHYTRNLIYRSPLFELLALCWRPGHRAWVHNHRGQHCWMAVTEGRLLVRNYRRLGCDQIRRTVRLEPTAELVVTPGSLAAVDPAEPVHAVWNPGETGQPAVSLHVYSLPFDTCVSYDLDRGLCRDVPLRYTSANGTRTDAHPPFQQLAAAPCQTCTLGPADQAAHCGVSPS
jgi:cysteine dioxygenase